MRMILLELKKLFRLPRLILMLALLGVFCFMISGRQLTAAAKANTAAYPEQFTGTDEMFGTCSLDLLFHDHLLERYGETVTAADLPRLASEREQLRSQITAAAAQDPILLRNGLEFHPETEEFTDSIDKDSARELSEEDWDYIMSCYGGQRRLKGTDHPVGFLSKSEAVMDWVAENGAYHVMSSDLLALMKDNFLIVIVFSCGALLLVVPYGVLEAKSRTEGLSASTKTGRAHYGKKLAAAVLAAATVIGLGILLAVLAFFQWKVSRYYGCEIGDAMDMRWNITTWNGVTFGAFYGLRMLLLFLLGLAVNVLATLLSLRIKNAVTAIACTLPLALLLLVYHLAYNSPSIGFLKPFHTSGHPCEIVAGLFILTIVISATKVWNDKRKDIYA